MIAGIGIDIVDVGRIEGLIRRHGERFLRRVFTPGEVEYCGGKKHALSLHCSGRFAAKEAFVKALGTGFGQGITYTDIEVAAGHQAPEIILHNRAREIAEARGISRVHLSLSHERLYATAVVILEGPS